MMWASEARVAASWFCTRFLEWTTTLLIFKVLVFFAKLLESALHYTFLSSSWAKCVVDVASCLCPKFCCPRGVFPVPAIHPKAVFTGGYFQPWMNGACRSSRVRASEKSLQVPQN